MITVAAIVSVTLLPIVHYRESVRSGFLRPFQLRLRWVLIGRLNRRLALIRALHFVFARGFALVSDANSSGELLVLGVADGRAKMKGIGLLEREDIVRVHVRRKPVMAVDVLSIAFKMR